MVFGDLLLEVMGALREARGPDGGFGPRPGLPSEPEETALAAIALDDDQARAWLEAHQRADGSFAPVEGPIVNDSATALAAIALAPGDASRRAIDHVLETPAARVLSDPRVPHDPDLRGWAWTEGTFGWVEPTSRALLGLRLLRPDATDAIGEAVATLRDREVQGGGGWNHGNPLAFGVHLSAYGQTTALALMALRGLDAGLEARGLAALQRLWGAERDGSLTLATSVAALRLYDDRASEGPAAAALAASSVAPRFEGDVVTLAWTAIALGPGLDVLRGAA